jgi:hypothetical protein
MTIKLRLDSFFLNDIEIGVRNSVLPTVHSSTIAGKKVGHQISVSFEKFDVVQALLSFFWHYSSWQFKNLFYTPIFLFEMPSSFDKGRVWLELGIK